MIRSLAAATAVAAALALTACGSEDSAPANGPEATVRTFLDAVHSGAAERACSQFTDERREEAKNDADEPDQPSCEAAYSAGAGAIWKGGKTVATDASAGTVDVSLGQVELAGDHAVEDRHRFFLVKEGGSWKIARNERLDPAS